MDPVKEKELDILKESDRYVDCLFCGGPLFVLTKTCNGLGQRKIIR